MPSPTTTADALVGQIEERLSEVTADADKLRADLEVIEEEEKRLQKALYALAPDRKPPRPEGHGKPGPKPRSPKSRPPMMGEQSLREMLAFVEQSSDPVTVKQIAAGIGKSDSGVSYGTQQLREQGLLRIAGRASLPGKPILWAAVAGRNGSVD